MQLSPTRRSRFFCNFAATLPAQLLSAGATAKSPTLACEFLSFLL
jgi:hypothetical protein